MLQNADNTARTRRRSLTLALTITLTLTLTLTLTGLAVGSAVQTDAGEGQIIRKSTGWDVAFLQKPSASPTYMHVLGSGAAFAVDSVPGSMGTFIARLWHESVSIESHTPCMKLAIRFRLGRKNVTR